MARKDYRVDEVLKDLSKKNDCKIVDYTIFILTNEIRDEKTDELIPNPEKRFDLGNKSWGKIDFLKNYNEYRINYISKFSNLRKQ